MGKIIILLFFVIGLIQELSGAITLPLQKKLDSLGLNEAIRVIVYLKDHADVSHIPVSNKPARVAYLKEFAQQKQRAILQYAQTLGGLDIKPFWVFNGFAVTLPADKIPVLAARPEVDYITCNTAMQLDTLGYGGGAPQPQTQWNIIKVRANEVWNMGYRGEGIVVGNMDTGVLVTHEAFEDRWREENGWFDAVEGQSSPIDETGHGTHCMGILTGAGPYGIGVAPGATFIAVRTGKYNGGWQKEDVLEGFQWVADLASIGQEPDVMSNSWGWADGQYNPGPHLEFWESINTWRTLDIIPIFCVGNTGLFDLYPWDPGKYPTVIGVGATDEFDEQARFSLPGPSRNESPYNESYYWSRPDWNLIKPDLMAPGTKDDAGIGIYSAYNDGGYEYLEGTSQATPHITGAIALMLEASRDKWHYDLNYYDIYDILLETADRNVGAPHPNYNYGWGRLDCYAAVNAVLNYHLKSTSPLATGTNNQDRIGYGGNKWHMVYESGGPMDSYVRYTVSTDNGATWSLEANGANGERIGKIGEGNSPALSVLSNGDAHIVWLDGANLLYSKKLASNSVWTEPVILYCEESTQKTPSFVVNPSTNIGHIAFVNESVFGKKVVYGWFDTQDQNPILNYFSIDQGEVSNPSIGLNQNGLPHIAWQKSSGLMQAIYYTCAPDWIVEQISNSVKLGIASADLVVSPYNGTVVAVWEEKNGSNFDIRCRRKVLGAWQSLEWVCQTVEESRHPAIVANTFKNHYYVVWAESTADYDWEIMFSMDDGSGWQTPENLSGYTDVGSKNPQIGLLSNQTGVGDMAVIVYEEGSLITPSPTSQYVPVYDIKTVVKSFPIGGGPQAKGEGNYNILFSIQPNPFRNHLVIKFQMPNSNDQTNPKSQIPIRIYDATGRLVRSFSDLLCNPNNSVHSVLWFGDDDLGRKLPAGVYFVRFVSGDYGEVEKAVLLR